MKLLKYFLFFTFFLFIPKIYALELTTVYTSPTMSTSGKVIWLDLITPKEQSLGVVQASASYGFSFFINKSTQIGEIYKIQINFNDYDYLHSNTANYWRIVGYNGTSVSGDCNLIGFEMKNQGSNTQMKTVIVMYQCPTVNSGIMFYNEDQSGDNLTRISTISWRINSIQWEHITDTSTSDIINNNTNNTNNIINNNNENTQDIIAGQSSQADRIIQNQNDIAQQQEQQQKVCNVIDKNNVVINDKYLTSNGNLTNISGWGITDYIDIYKAEITFVPFEFTTSSSTCFYDVNKTLLNCYVNNTLSSITIPTNSYYMRISLLNSSNKPRATVCKNGNQALNDSLTDDDIGGSASDMGDFLNGFNTNTFGLTSIISAPLNLIQSLTSSTCTKLELPLPYLSNKKLELPCMTPIYQSTFGSLFTMYQTITFGIIAYWVCVRIFNMVKDFKNPEHDEIEVVDL